MHESQIIREAGAQFAPWHKGSDGIFCPMQILFAALALVFLVISFTGFALGGLPTIFFWFLAALCIGAAWSMRSRRQRVREDQNQAPHPR
jgi:hypothetical protein